MLSRFRSDLRETTNEQNKRLKQFASRQQQPHSAFPSRRIWITFRAIVDFCCRHFDKTLAGRRLLCHCSYRALVFLLLLVGSSSMGNDFSISSACLRIFGWENAFYLLTDGELLPNGSERDIHHLKWECVTDRKVCFCILERSYMLLMVIVMWLFDFSRLSWYCLKSEQK